MVTPVISTELARARRRILMGTLAFLSSFGVMPTGQARGAAPTVAGTGVAAIAGPHADHFAPTVTAVSTATSTEVWKTPTRGCCKVWVQHLEASGFTVKAVDVTQTAPIRVKLQIPSDLAACHNAMIAEPESLPQQVIGLSVPGMPIGSSRMELGTNRDKFDVMLVLNGSQRRVYQSYSSRS